MDQKPVFNKIRLIERGERHIWKMKQSHFGPSAPKNLWDEIQIVVDKMERPYKVTYHQLKEGVEVEYKANCLSCHSSGPRFIRPKGDLSLKDKLTVPQKSIIKGQVLT